MAEEKVSKTDYTPLKTQELDDFLLGDQGPYPFDSQGNPKNVGEEV